MKFLLPLNNFHRFPEPTKRILCAIIPRFHGRKTTYKSYILIKNGTTLVRGYGGGKVQHLCVGKYNICAWVDVQLMY